MPVAPLVVLACVASCGGVAYRDVALQGAFTTALVADALQTQVITARCTEANPVIGRCGELVPLDVYFPGI